MSWFNRKKKLPPPPVDPVVDARKERVHNAAQDVQQSADKLTKVFQKNGITLTILKAAGGGHGH